MERQQAVRCPACGAALSVSGVAARLCAACLLKAVMGEASDEGDDQGAPLRVLTLIGGTADSTQYLAERDPGRHLVVAEVLRRTAAPGLTPGIFEARVRDLLALDHPALARILEGRVLPGGDYCLISEFVPGTAIDRFCTARGSSLEERQQFLEAARGALTAVHEAGVIHGRITSEAFVMTDHGHGPRLRLVQFALHLPPGTTSDRDRDALRDVALSLGVRTDS